jgi:hypothetical protein
MGFRSPAGLTVHETSGGRFSVLVEHCFGRSACRYRWPESAVLASWGPRIPASGGFAQPDEAGVASTDVVAAARS